MFKCLMKELEEKKRRRLNLRICLCCGKNFDVLKYIRECFGIFHVEGDEAVFEDVKEYLKIKGAVV